VHHGDPQRAIIGGRPGIGFFHDDFGSIEQTQYVGEAERDRLRPSYLQGTSVHRGGFAFPFDSSSIFQIIYIEKIKLHILKKSNYGNPCKAD
jgi:hypothetical protein